MDIKENMQKIYIYIYILFLRINKVHIYGGDLLAKILTESHLLELEGFQD